MSKLINDIKNKKFKFVIPTPGKCFKSKISKNDKLLLLVLNKGYIETSDIETCYYITLFLNSHKGNIFIPVGNIEKIRKPNNKIVYRQRIFFKSLSIFLLVMKELHASIIIDSKFSVTTNSLMNVIDDLPILERYAKDLKSDVNTWLTHVCKILIYEACKKLDMCSQINIDESIYNIPHNVTGYLNRAPLLCGSYNIEKHTSSVFRVEDLSNKSLYDIDINNIVISGKGKSKSLLDYGFTDNNVKEDIKRGVFKS